MKLEQTFEVQAPLEQVWAALNDLERVAPCLPGAAITDHDEDGTYRGTFTVKLGPMTAAYNGTIKIEEADEATHTATLKARGTDKRGQGGANATIVNTLTEHDGGTQVSAVTDFSITGRLAQFGRGGIMQDVSNRLLRDFATCLSTRLAEAPAAAGGPAAEGPAAEGPAAEGPAAEGPAAEPGSPPDGPAPEEVASAATAAPSTPPPAPAAKPPPAAAPLKGGSLFFSVIWERIKGLFRRG
jgi:uncharacterized protein